MKIKGFELDEKKFVRIILLAFFFVFILSFSWRLSFYFFDAITIFSGIGIILMPIFTLAGLIIYPISAFVYSLLPTQIGFIPVNLSTIFDFAALTGILFFVFYKNKQKNTELNINDYLAFGFLVLLGLLSVYHGVNISFSNYWLVLSVTAILIYFVVSRTIYKKELLRIFLWMFLLMVLAIMFRYTFYARGFQESFLGSFDNNMFSRDLVLIIPLVIYMFWSEKNKILKGVLLISLGILLQNFVVMGSRASWISLAPVLLLLGIKNIKRRSTWGFGILGFMFVIIFILSSPQIINEIFSIQNVEGGTESEEGSIQGRFEAMNAGIDAFKERPILGWGPSNHVSAVQNEMVKQGMVSRATHNAYLEIMVGMGIIGILFYLMLFVYSGINAYKAQKIAKGKDEYIYNISWGLIFGLIAVALNQTMINRSYAPIIWIGLGLSTALYFIAKNLKNNKDEKETKMELLQQKKEISYSKIK